MKRPATLLLVAALLSSYDMVAQGDACAGATTLACGAVANGSTVAFTADVAPVCGTTDGTAGGVWYRFVGTGVSTTASLCGSAFDTKIRVYSGTCGALVCVVGNDDFCGLQSQVTWPATLATDYFILVHGFGAATGNYTLNITCAAPPVPMCYSQAVVPYSADPYAGTALTLSDDIHSAVVNIGFSYCYNGTTYTQCVISSNNYVTFNLANAGTYSPWPTVAVPNTIPAQIGNSILNPWQDIHPGLGGTITYQTTGVAPNRRFVVSYLNVPMYSCTTQRYSSQTVLYEGTNCIGSFILEKNICPGWNGGNAVHALHNNGGTSAAVVPGRNNTQWLAASLGMLFIPTCTPCSTSVTAQCVNLLLPIELLQFRGRNEGGANVLEWATASEQDNDLFIVERGNDGEHFTAINEVAGAGNSNNVIEYLVRDNDPIIGVNYYRLRQLDVDGDEELSPVIAVHAYHTGVISLYPNPASTSVSYQLDEEVALPVLLEVHDLAGRSVHQTLLSEPFGILDISALKSGVYLVDLAGCGTLRTMRFTVE